MSKSLKKITLVALLAMASILAGRAATADLNADDSQNAQEGDNGFDAGQSGTSSSGDGVAGQVAGVVSAGDASVDATNRSEDVDISTGDTLADNDASAYSGLLDADDVNIGVADVSGDDVDNLQEGDNDGSLDQTATASSGDGVGGQVVGVVTSAGGSADLVLANTSEDVDVETGDSDFFNDADVFVGLADVDDFDLGGTGDTGATPGP